MKIKKSPKGEKIIQGVYEYCQGSHVYSEEEFEVYRVKNDSSLMFVSNMYSRMASGEMLNYCVDYVASKDYLPQKVFIEKELGQHKMTEIYYHEKGKSIVNYFFISDNEEKHFEIPVTPCFHISTPTTVSSMLFLNEEEGRSVPQSFHTVIGSENKWHFSSIPQTNSVIIDRSKVETRNIEIGDQLLTALVYNLYENVDGRNNFDTKMPYLEIYMSSYINIPYVLKDQKELCIKIKKFETFF